MFCYDVLNHRCGIGWLPQLIGPRARFHFLIWCDVVHRLSIKKPAQTKGKQNANENNKDDIEQRREE